MKTAPVIALCAALSGCATEPLTPEQAALFMQVYQGQMALQQQQQHNSAILQQHIFRPAPLVQPAQAFQPAPFVRYPRCVTRTIGSVAYTDCY